MPKKSSPKSPPPKSTHHPKSPKKLLLLPTLTLFLLTISFIIWYPQQPPHVQKKVQSIALNILDPIRDAEFWPDDIQYLLDLLADQIPLNQPTTFHTPNLEFSTHSISSLPSSPLNPQILKNIGYISAYSNSLKNPLWVAYKVFYNPSGSTIPRPNFSPDKRTSPPRVLPSHYSKSGYDRGHLAPNYAIGVCYGPTAQTETFLMSNISPQKPELNRKIWKNIEHREVKRLARRFGPIAIITGPIFQNPPPTFFPKNPIPIPSAFFKIIINAPTPNSLRVIALIIPQSPANSPPKAFLTSIRHIESLTHINFFPSLPTPLQDQIESHISPTVW